MNRRRALLALLLPATALVVYLRDPPWVLAYSHGFDAWHTLPDGRRARWMKARASFHVPSEVRSMTLPMRSLKQFPADWPITATVLIDDRPATHVTFHHEEWHPVTVRLPPPGGRRARRIDIKLDRLREHGRGIELGDVELHR